MNKYKRSLYANKIHKFFDNKKMKFCVDAAVFIVTHE